MFHPRGLTLTVLAMLAFAGNSILCRLALRETPIDAATFTSIRLISGAIILGLITQIKGRSLKAEGSWPSALTLFIYASGFSFAYIQLAAVRGRYCFLGQYRSP